MTVSAVLASTALALLAATAALARRRSGRPGRGDGPVVSGRALLSRDAGVAVVQSRGQALLVGWGREGVRLLARLGAERRP